MDIIGRYAALFVAALCFCAGARGGDAQDSTLQSILAAQTSTQGTTALGTAPTYGVPALCLYRAAPAAPSDGQTQAVPCGQYGVTVAGAVPSGTAAAGMPIPLGAEFNSAPASVSSGQRTAVQSTNRGFIISALGDASSSNVAAVGAASSDAVSASNSGLNSSARLFLYNGSTFDRQFTCANTASLSVTAGSTTQLVALQASQTIRVCSVVVSMSAAGTAGLVYGTGANCGTGTTTVMADMPLATGVPLTINGGAGSVLRTASANALCGKAVTGNAVFLVTYAQF